MKSKLEQEQDFKLIAFWADPNCKICFGTAKAEWIHYLGDREFNQYRVCECVLKNVRKAKEESAN